jgi:predicted Zn finger-like uncharacterized protein
MNMVTTCLHCGTSFRVTPDHLRARGGQVRCGRCTKVFDGFQKLTTLDAVVPDATQPVIAEAQVTASPLERVAAPKPLPADDAPMSQIDTDIERPGLPIDVPLPEQTPELSTPQVKAEPAASIDEASGAGVNIQLISTQDFVLADPLVAEENPEPLSALETERGVTEAPTTQGQDIGERLTSVPLQAVDPASTQIEGPEQYDYPDEAEKNPRHGSGLWAFAAAIALIALTVQAIHTYRNELGSQYPALKPVLVRFCEYAACKLMPLQRPDALKIEASDLQVTDPSRPSVIQLTATLRNYSNREVGYPALDLVLTDNREHTLVRRVFSPADYLARADAVVTGIAANAEVTVRLDIDVGALGASGFRLNLAPATAI